MFSLILLTVIGQQPDCGPLGCPPNVFEVGFGEPAKGQTYPIREIAIKHEGLTFTVRGYVKDGLVNWERTDPFNARSYAAAKAKDEAHKTGRNLTGSVANYGIEPTRLRRGPTYTANGDNAHRFVQDAISSGTTLVNPKVHLTVIGMDADKASLIRDLGNHPALVALKPKMFVQDYRPGEWPVDPALGFVAGGKPTIIVQTAKGISDPKGGRVVYRASDYSMGPEALAEAVRKAIPDYKPESDPGPATGNSPTNCPFGFSRLHWPYLIAAALVVIVVAKLPRKGA